MTWPAAPTGREREAEGAQGHDGLGARRARREGEEKGGEARLRRRRGASEVSGARAGCSEYGWSGEGSAMGDGAPWRQVAGMRRARVVHNVGEGAGPGGGGLGVRTEGGWAEGEKGKGGGPLGERLFHFSNFFLSSTPLKPK